MKSHYYILFLFLYLPFKQANASEYLEVKPNPGDGIENLLERHLLEYNSISLSRFKNLNQNILPRNNSLYLSKTYKLPIKIYTFNGKTIRSTIGINDYDEAKRIQDYNDYLFTKGVKEGNFRIDKELWVPEVDFFISYSDASGQVPVPQYVTKDYQIFGDDHKSVKELTHTLKDRVFYIVGGHGGPDPGAIGFRSGNELHEDEYAYDVSLRLARKLLEHGATVYIIVQDKEDGIRDDKYLLNSFDEYYYGNNEISRNQLQRLRKRVEIINQLYEKHKNSAKEQIVVPIHVDSRENKRKRIDIFFYHNRNSDRGKEIAEELLNTMKEKYNEAQPGRGYYGSVTSRGLFMLNQTIPVTIYIELGNIQNARDQIRLIEENNRQAIANWLTEGFLKIASMN